MSDEGLTPEKAEFIEQRVIALHQYTIDCYDRARAEGNNVLQWHFALVTGGLALVGALLKDESNALAGGAAFAVGAGSYSAFLLIRCLRSRHIWPPGNQAKNLDTLIDIPFHRMRWRAAQTFDPLIQDNIHVVEQVTTQVDKARERLALVPAWFVAGIAAVYLLRVFNVPGV